MSSLSLSCPCLDTQPVRRDDVDGYIGRVLTRGAAIPVRSTFAARPAPGGARAGGEDDVARLRVLEAEAVQAGGEDEEDEDYYFSD